MPDNYGYPATVATFARCHLREHGGAMLLPLPVIWQLRARRQNRSRNTRGRQADRRFGVFARLRIVYVPSVAVEFMAMPDAASESP